MLNAEIKNSLARFIPSQAIKIVDNGTVLRQAIKWEY